jgi:hypothetical protein
MSDIKNVREPWVQYDSICVCSQLYGSEANAGFFTSFVAFGQQPYHLLFKRRSEGNVHRAYCNQQSEDRTDFVFWVFEVGLLFLAPPTPLDINTYGEDEGADEYMSPFWTGVLPRHTSAKLKIGQDEKLHTSAMMLNPGYGPYTSAATFGTDHDSGYKPEFVWAGTQGDPVPQSRYWLPITKENGEPGPIGIPKNELVEMRLEISEHARNTLQASGGPGVMNIGNTGAIIDLYTRYRIQVALWGYREVQQRGQLRAS